MKKTSALIAALLVLLGLTSAAQAEGRGPQCGDAPRLDLTFVESFADGRGDTGQFSITFTAKAIGGRRCVSRSVSRENFAILDGNNRPVKFLVAVTNPSLRALGDTSLDTSTHYCVRRKEVREFVLGISLESPEEDGFFRVQLKKFGDGKVKYFPSKDYFRTPSVFLSSHTDD